MQASVQFLCPMNPSCHLGLDTLELIVSPIQPVPVQGLFLTSTCSTLLFFFHISALPPFTPLTLCLISALDGCRGCCPPFPVLIALVGSELRERIKEGFKPSSLCSYYPLSSAIAAPAHSVCLLCYTPSHPLPISHTIIFLDSI